MVAESTPPPEKERYLSPAGVAARFLTRIESVHEWINEGKLEAVTDASGRIRIAESAVLSFERQAYRRENFPGVGHGLHSWPVVQPAGSNLPVPVETAEEGERRAARWPYPPGQPAH